MMEGLGDLSLHDLAGASRLCLPICGMGAVMLLPWLLLEMINLKLPWHVACAKNMPCCHVEASLDEIYNEVRREALVAGCRSMAETGSGKGGAACRAGWKSEQSPSMRLSLAAWWDAQTNTK